MLFCNIKRPSETIITLPDWSPLSHFALSREAIFPPLRPLFSVPSGVLPDQFLKLSCLIVPKLLCV